MGTLHMSLHVSLSTKYYSGKREQCSDSSIRTKTDSSGHRLEGALPLRRQAVSKTRLLERKEPPSQPSRPTTLRNHSHLPWK